MDNRLLGGTPDELVTNPIKGEIIEVKPEKTDGNERNTEQNNTFNNIINNLKESFTDDELSVVKNRLTKIISSEYFSIRMIKNELEGKTKEEIEEYLSNLEEEINDQIEINITTNQESTTTETFNKINQSTSESADAEQNNINEMLKNLENLYPGISDDFKPNQEEQTQKKLEIENNPRIKQRLESQGINIDQYVNYSITRDKIQSSNQPQSEELRQFVESVNQLDDLLGIPRITAKGYPMSYNEHLSTPGTEALKKDKNIQELENETKIGEGIESLKDCLSLAKLYGFKGEYDKELLNNIAKTNPQLTNLTDIDKQKILDFTSGEEMNKIKEKHNERIRNYTTGFASQTPIFSLINYLDYSKSTEETLANKLSQASEKGNLGNERTTIGENGELEIKGFIDNNPITLYYNLNGEKHNLLCDDILNINNNIITLNKKGKTDLNINMPNIKEIAEGFKNINYGEILKNARNLEDYQRTLTETMYKKAKKLFPDNKEVKRRLNKNIEKNLTTQSICNTLIPEKFQSNINSDLSSNAGDTPIKKILTMIDNTTEFSSSNKLSKIKNNFNSLNNFIKESDVTDPNNQINKIRSPLKEYITKIKSAQETEDYNTRENNITEFLSIFTITTELKNRDYSIDEEALDTTVKYLTKQENITENELNGFSEDFKLQIKMEGI